MRKYEEEHYLFDNIKDKLIIFIIDTYFSNYINSRSYYGYVIKGEYAGETVREYVRSFKIANNFIYNLFNEVKYTHNDVIDEFASEICLELQNNIINEINED